MAIIKPNNNTLSAITGLPTGVGGKILAAKITTLAPPAADVTTTSTTYAEMNSAMRITHAMSNSSNKLIFTFSSTDMYVTGCNGQVGVAKTTAVGTSIIGNQLFLVKVNANVEVDTRMGSSVYAPGATTEFTYTPVFARIGNSGTFYINNSVNTSRWTFTLMEIA